MLTMFLIWAALATVVLGLAAWRKLVSRNEDDFIHVNDVKLNARQSEVAHTLDSIDRWGKILTIVVAAYGLVLLAAYMYSSWQAATQIAP